MPNLDGLDGLDIRSAPGYSLLKVKVTPKASRNECVGVAEGCLRIRVQAPPVEGAANEKVREFLADLLGLRRRDVSLERGQTGREKVFRIVALDAGEIRRRLASA